jgi:Response regulator containing a CheY-like receiver domain and a GGDEF domain
MRTEILNIHTFATTRAVRKVVVVSKRAAQDVLDTVLDAGDYDVVFVEGIAHAYSRIKHVMPSLVIVCLSVDDLDGFHLLSMLKLDGETARIPVVTYTAAPVDAIEDDSVDADDGFAHRRMTASSMN